ncbi:MAG: terminase gpA endonuclease subunit [Planctomycetota bacterium]
MERYVKRWLCVVVLMVSPIVDELRWLAEHAHAPRPRSMRRFAEEAFVVPEGQFAGLRWSAHRQPCQGLLLDAIDSGRFNRFVALGCVQSGKSLIDYTLPTLYHLFELQETVINGVPTMDVCKDKWRKELLPAINANATWRRLLPKRGPGSRGGTGNLESVTFRSGVELKFMSSHGGDEKRSSYTSRVVVMTEVDKMDEAGEASRETDPVSQIENRQSSYDEPLRRTYLECTVSIEQGRIWQEYLRSTRSRVACPCPHCGKYVTPERDHLCGAAEADTEYEAAERGHFVCPGCEHALTEDERREMNRRAILLHHGQDVADDRSIVGDTPRTRSLGFRWNAFNNLFWSTATIARKAWQVAHATHEESALREWLQFYWAEPYQPPDIEERPLEAQAIAQRKQQWPQNVLPADTEIVVVGADVGKWQCWYLVWAVCRSGQVVRLHVPDYDVIDVHSDSMAEKKAILLALRNLRDRVAAGWIVEGSGERKTPDAVWIDSNYETETVFQFVREAGAPFLPILGRGVTSRGNQGYSQPAKPGPNVQRLGDAWHVERVPKHRAHRVVINVDHYKRQLHQLVALPVEASGAVTLFDALGNRHLKLAKHWTAEQFLPLESGGYGWVKTSKSNHWLDCAGYGLAAANFKGLVLAVAEPGPEAPKAKDIGEYFREIAGRRA